MPNDTVAIVFLTYARTHYALRTIESVINRLRVPGRLCWYLADDGSEDVHVASCLRELEGQDVIGMHSERIGYGAGANRAWHVAHDHADITLWLEDDWELKKPLDVSPYVTMLNERDDVGMIRIAHLSINLHAKTVGYRGNHYLLFDWDRQYTFSGNPSLRHRRAREYWGPYPEGLNPGDTEIAYDSQVRNAQGPAIVWPVDLGGWGVFGHIGELKSYG